MNTFRAGGEAAGREVGTRTKCQLGKRVKLGYVRGTELVLLHIRVRDVFIFGEQNILVIE